MSIRSIYLAGSVPKSDEEIARDGDWRVGISEKLLEIDPGLMLFDPRNNNSRRNDPKGVFGATCGFVRDADLTIIHVSDRMGPGTAQEMIVAKYYHKPVILILPRDTHHRRSNVSYEGKVLEEWIHPFLHETADVIIESVNDVQSALEKIESIEIKDVSCVDDAIAYYESQY